MVKPAFKEITSNRTTLVSIFNNDEDLNTCTKKFIRSINQCIRKCFRKIRITSRPNKEMEELFKKRQRLKASKDEKSRKDLEEVEEQLADLCAQDNFEKINEEINGINCDEGGFNSSHLWKLKKKLSPRCRDPPTAMMDSKGNLVTSSKSTEQKDKKSTKM